MQRLSGYQIGFTSIESKTHLNLKIVRHKHLSSKNDILFRIIAWNAA